MLKNFKKIIKIGQSSGFLKLTQISHQKINKKLGVTFVGESEIRGNKKIL